MVFVIIVSSEDYHTDCSPFCRPYIICYVVADVSEVKVMGMIAVIAEAYIT